VPFEERDIMKNRAFIDELLERGSRSTPTTVVMRDDGGEEMVVGFDRHRLARLLGLT
jgi:hypothetical protein